jgi:hypothetical protein
MAAEAITMGQTKPGDNGRLHWAALILGVSIYAPALAGSCSAQSGAALTPVIELYTSQGCSSCPPADRWLSTLSARGGNAAPVIQAFHVAYWDYIGWVDRFAAPVHTQRQRQLATWNGLRSVYTPQVLLNARDWRDWRHSGDTVPQATEPALGRISLVQRSDGVFEGTVTLQSDAPPQWAAYWTVTEDRYQTAVGAGENAGERLRNDHVVRQYVPAGDYRTQAAQPHTLLLHAVAASADHARAINLVVFDPRNGRTLQALALRC